MMAFLAELGAWSWLIAALILVILEMILPGIHFLWFGLAASLVGIIALVTGIDWQWQLLIFGILSVATALFVRRFVTSQNTPTDEPGLNERGAYYVGRIVVIEEAIKNGRGRVRLGDTLWAAEGPDLDAGAKAKVTRLDGTLVVVEPVED